MMIQIDRYAEHLNGNHHSGRSLRDASLLTNLLSQTRDLRTQDANNHGAEHHGLIDEPQAQHEGHVPDPLVLSYGRRSTTFMNFATRNFSKFCEFAVIQQRQTMALQLGAQLYFKCWMRFIND